MSKCQVDGCGQLVNKNGHSLCYRHWKMQRDGQLTQTASGKWQEVADADQANGDEFGDNESSMISSTRLGRHFGLPAPRANQILAELGWIEKYVKGWTPTDQGNRMGAEVREMRQSGVPYVVWPRSILRNHILLSNIAELAGETTQPAGDNGLAPAASESHAEDRGFRSRFPAEYRAADGHWVRSRAEMLIDNWLYMQGIVHAVERKLPIEEEAYCDFYLPTGKTYIEYWGMEKDAKYAERMKAKQAIYAKYNLNLVELHDKDIMNIDDILPRLLLRFKIDCT